MKYVIYLRRLSENLASEEYLSILLKEFHTNERNKRDEASQILVRFGDVILNRLLDIVHEVSDSKERVNVIASYYRYGTEGNTGHQGSD